MSIPSIRRKLVVVGDDACGKTCLFTAYALGRLPENTYVPTIFGGYVADVEVEGQAVELALWDTSADDAYERLRPLNYLSTHVILICFAVDSPASLESAKEKVRGLGELTHHCPGVPVILDLWKMNQQPVSVEEGMAAAQKIGAKGYLECSAKTGEGVREVINTAARAALTCKPKKRMFRSVL
ncbi:small GTPase-binding protein, partial [Coprinopsis sp. MPI-PUGE-AT-0042]